MPSLTEIWFASTKVVTSGSEHYMKAWMLVAKEHPQVKFYAYTKSLTMWYHLQDDINSNFYLTASHGGNEDSMLEKFPEVYKRIAYVVYTEQEAADRGLEDRP